MEPIRCFLLVETERAQVSLRRFTGPGCHGPGSWGYHNASVVLGDEPVFWDPTHGRPYLGIKPDVPEDDPRWPQKCQWCEHRFVGFPFTPQVNQEPYYRRVDTGEEMLLAHAPLGAIWEAPWMAAGWHGPDGKAYYCLVPKRHEWFIDGPARNGDGAKSAWTRVGTPPRLTAYPSIQTPTWHGYLERGWLVDAREQAPKDS